LLAALFGTALGVSGALAVGARAAEHRSHKAEVGVVASPYFSVAATPTTRTSPSALPWAFVVATTAVVAALGLWIGTSRRTAIRVWRAESLLRVRGPPLAL
jgi:hypothetical protein